MRHGGCGDEASKRQFTTEDAEFTEACSTRRLIGQNVSTIKKQISHFVRDDRLEIVRTRTNEIPTARLVKDGGEGGVGDFGGDGLDVGGEGAVFGDLWRDGADGGDGFFGERAGLEWG
jgi:hypothetical protein